MIKNALWLFVVTFVILIIFLPSYTKLQDLRVRSFDYENEIKHLKAENARLYDENKRLEDDPVYLEKVAREKMGLAKEGEVMYKITPVNKVEAPKKKP